MINHLTSMSGTISEVFVNMMTGSEFHTEGGALSFPLLSPEIGDTARQQSTV